VLRYWKCRVAEESCVSALQYYQCALLILLVCFLFDFHPAMMMLLSSWRDINLYLGCWFRSLNTLPRLLCGVCTLSVDDLDCFSMFRVIEREFVCCCCRSLFRSIVVLSERFLMSFFNIARRRVIRYESHTFLWFAQKYLSSMIKHLEIIFVLFI
jgi:hypothetical protein